MNERRLARVGASNSNLDEGIYSDGEIFERECSTFSRKKGQTRASQQMSNDLLATIHHYDHLNPIKSAAYVSTDQATENTSSPETLLSPAEIPERRRARSMVDFAGISLEEDNDDELKPRGTTMEEKRRILQGIHRRDTPKVGGGHKANVWRSNVVSLDQLKARSTCAALQTPGESAIRTRKPNEKITSSSQRIGLQRPRKATSGDEEFE